MSWLRRSNLWLPTMGSQREAKCYTEEFNGSPEAKGLWSYLIILQKRDPFSVETYNRGQNTLSRYFIDYS